MGKMLPLIVPADIDTPRTVIVLEDNVIPPRSEAIIAGKVDNSFVACCEASGYWQVELDPVDKYKTAFITRQGLFEFNVLSFGLCNSPSTFQRLMDLVLADLQWTTCLVYLDDIIIFGRTFQEHLGRLDEVLIKLRQANLKVKPTKCNLFATQVQYLGHIISSKGVKADPAKVEAVRQWPVPKNQTEVRSVVGLASYNRRFEKGFAEIARPLHQLTEKEITSKSERSVLLAGWFGDVKRWCRECVDCGSRKAVGKQWRAPLQSVVTSRPYERVAVDILGPLPETPKENKYIVVIGDYFSKWMEAFPFPNREAETVAKLLVEQWVCRFGAPRIIHTDQGRNFESRLFKEVCQLLNIYKTRTSPYHPQSDVMVERFNRTLASMLSLFVDDNQANWDILLQYVMMAYRSSVHSSTGFTPYKVVFGREIILPVDVMLNVTSQEGAESPRIAGVPPKETWLQTSDSTAGRESEVAVPGARSEVPPVTPRSGASGVPGSSAASVGSQWQRDRLAPTTQDQSGQGSSHTGHMQPSMTSQVPMTGEVQQGGTLSKDLHLGRAKRAPMWSRDYEIF
ncbi:uncharacterized protein LOC132155519 [Carassius carassius]|uniref:uncharacterized protein LOC132155519 n=1 Tax=Carassius carassius TaxID=217509 RepID=UPI0028686C9D|nr:uncharacterized protein LOC132155519 [Carassius carassius]